MISVFKREFKSFFCGFIGYSFVGIFALCYLTIRMMYNYMLLYENIYGFMNQEYILALLPVAAVLATPLLTFTMYEEERNKNVFSFLRSLPLSVKDIFLGKLLSRLALLGAACIGLTLIDLFLGFYSASSIITVAYSALSYFLVCAVILFLNIFLATAIKNKFLSLGVGYGIGIVLAFFTFIRYMGGHVFFNIIEPLSFLGTYASAVFGVADLSYLFLWVSLGGSFAFLSYLCFKKEMGHTDSLNKQKKKRISLSVTATIIASVVLFNVAVQFLPDYIRRFDITSAKSYTLSDSTKDYFSSLDEKVNIYVLDVDGSDMRYEYWLKRLDEASDNISVRWSSLEAEGERLATMGVELSEPSPYLLIVEGEKRSIAMGYSDLIIYRTDNSTIASYIGTNEMTASQYNSVLTTLAQYAYSSDQYASQYAEMLEVLVYDVEKYFIAESYLCKMVEYVTVDILPARYALTGHGEAVLSKTEMGYYLSDGVGMVYSDLDLSASGAIPEDAVSIMVINPKTDITKVEADILINYLNGGGQMTFFTTEANLDMPNLMSVMSAYGLTAERGAVSEIVEVEVETKNETETEAQTDTDNSSEDSTKAEITTVKELRTDVAVNVNLDHKATAQLKSVGVEISPTVSGGNSIIINNKDGFKLTPILTTSDNAYIGDNTEDLGPRALSAVSEKIGGGTLLWFTGADSYARSLLSKEEANNAEIITPLYSNIYVIISSLALAPVTYESSVIVPAAKYYGERLMSVTETSYVLYTAVIIALVVIMSVFGIIFWYKRKKA